MTVHCRVAKTVILTGRLQIASRGYAWFAWSRPRKCLAHSPRSTSTLSSVAGSISVGDLQVLSPRGRSRNVDERRTESNSIWTWCGSAMYHCDALTPISRTQLKKTTLADNYRQRGFSGSGHGIFMCFQLSPSMLSTSKWLATAVTTRYSSCLQQQLQQARFKLNWICRPCEQICAPHHSELFNAKGFFNVACYEQSLP